MFEQNRIFTLVLKNKKKHKTSFNTCNTTRATQHVPLYMRIMFRMLFEIIENGVLLLLLKTSKITSRIHRTHVYTMFRSLDFFFRLFFDV